MDATGSSHRAAVILGIDVGGTKVLAGAVEARLGGITTRLVASRQIATPRADPPAFYDALAALVRVVRRDAEARGAAVLPLLGVAHPGRFLPGGSLARATTPNLGTRPGMFDGVDPAGELRRRLEGSVFVENDAVAQMRSGLATLLCDPAARPHLVDRTLIYLGPGTGMGGGVARVGLDGEVTVITDGHLFDLQVPGYAGGTMSAEELFTGPAIARAVAQANRRLASPIEPATAWRVSDLLANPAAAPEHRLEVLRIADLQGDILALIIQALHAGRVVKVRLERTEDGHLVRHVDEPDRAWPAADRDAIRGTSRFLLGGSVGADPALGSHIRRRAIETLRCLGLSEIAIFQLPIASAEAGLLGAVRAVPAEEIRRTMLEDAKP